MQNRFQKTKIAIGTLLVTVGPLCTLPTVSENDIPVWYDSYIKTTQDVHNIQLETIVSTLNEDTNTPANNSDTSGDPVAPGTGNINPLPVPDDLNAIINMSFEDAFNIAVAGIGTYEDLKKYTPETEAALNSVRANNSETITVKLWKWENANDNSNMNKVSVDQNICCNRLIAPLLKACLDEIYNNPEKPVMRYDGCFVIRAMGHVPARNNNPATTSAHAFGCAIDFNATSTERTSTGAIKGNTLGPGHTPTYEEWCSMPETHAKYEIFHSESVVVKTFYKYGFYWGGSWNSSTDGMHFGFLGDNGVRGREIGQECVRSVGGN